MSIQELAALLLIGRLVSTGFILAVIRLQWRLLKLPIRKSLRGMRRVLFAISLVVLLGNIIPITIDILTIFADIPRTSGNPKPIGIGYAISSNLSSLLQAIFIWLLYRLAARTALNEDK